MNIFLSITAFIAKHLLVIHKGTLLAKLKSTVFLAIGTSPIAYVIEKITNWSVANSDYIIFVLGAIFIDHLLGSILHAFYLRDFSFKKNLTGILIKLSLTVTMGFLFEGINHLVQEESFVKTYLVIVLRLCVFLYPAGSAFMNCSVITKGQFPPIGWIERVKQFNKNLDLKKFKGEEDKQPDQELVEDDIPNER